MSASPSKTIGLFGVVTISSPRWANTKILGETQGWEEVPKYEVPIRNALLDILVRDNPQKSYMK